MGCSAACGSKGRRVEERMKIKHATDILQNTKYNTTISDKTNINQSSWCQFIEKGVPIWHIDEKSRVGGDERAGIHMHTEGLSVCYPVVGSN